MIIVRHHEKCAGNPSPTGHLTGKCDCKVAPMDEAARTVVTALLDTLDHESKRAEEDREYLALRLDMLTEMLVDASKQVRRRIKDH